MKDQKPSLKGTIYENLRINVRWNKRVSGGD
jgi:hypothetical protein